MTRWTVGEASTLSRWCNILSGYVFMAVNADLKKHVALLQHHRDLAALPEGPAVDGSKHGKGWQ